MFWTFWCYFGLSIVHFTHTQRRAVVDYSFTTTKLQTTSSTSSPIRNTPVDIPETSLNQIPRFATAPSGSHRIELPTNVDKRKESSQSSEPSLAKGDFAARERVNKTTSRESFLRGPPKNGSPRQVTSKENISKEGGTNIDSEVPHTRRVSSTIGNRPNIDEHTRNVSRDESRSDLKKVSDPVDIEDAYNPRNADEKSINGKDSNTFEHNNKTSIPTTYSGNDKDFATSIISNSKQTDETTYPDPEFERSHAQRTSVDEIRRGYGDEDIPRRDRDPSRDRYSKGDGRVVPKDTLESSSPISEEKRYRDPYPEDDKYYDRYPSGRRGDVYDEDRHRDRIPDDRKFTDRYSRGERRRAEDRIADDRYKYETPDNVRYSDGRTKEGDDSKYRDEELVRDNRRLDRLPDEDKYTGRYPDSRRREAAEERPSRDSYRDRELAGTRYSSEGRIREDGEKYDSRPINRDRYLERRPDDYKYTDRYPDEDTQRKNRDKYDDTLIREDRYKDRIPDDGRYVDKYPDEVIRGDDDKYDSRLVRKDGDYDRRADERHLEAGRRRNSEDRYRDRNYDERSKYGDDRVPYKETRIDDIPETNRNRNGDEGSYRSRDRTDIRGSRTQTSSRYDDRDKDDQYRLRVDDDRFRDDAYKSSERSLMSSRRDERFQPERPGSSRQDYTSRDPFEEPEYIPSKEYATTYTRTDISRPIRESTSEDRYRSISRNKRPDIPPRYDDRDRISPSRVREDTYVSHKDEAYISRPRSDDRRNEGRYSNERSDTLIRNTGVVGTRIENSRTYPDNREYRPTRADDIEKSRREEINLERRSYSSEEDDKYWDGKTRSRYYTDSRNRDRTFYEDRRRDYGQENSRSKYDEDVDEYRQERRSGYDTPSIRSTDTYTRSQVSRYDGNRDRRYESDRDRNHDLIDEDRDRHDRNRGDYDRHPTNKNHYGIVDNYGKDRDSYDSDIDSSRRSDKPNEDKIRSSYPDKSYLDEDTKSDLLGSQRTRYPADEIDKSLSSSVDSGLLSKHNNQRHSSESSLTKSVLPVRQRDSVVGSSIRRVEDSLPIDVTVRDKQFQGRSPEQNEERPLNAKDVIEAALRHTETHEQADRKVFYPVFDPRISNLTSPDIIRPSERRGTTITAKKKR